MFFLVMMVASGLINSQVKHIFRTLRPAAVFEQKTPADSISRMWRFPAARTVHIVGERLMQDSFPSGHTNTAFSAAMLMVLCFSKRFWPAFFIAGLVGYSRVYMGVHFPIDVFAGALFGIGIIWIGFICCNRFVRRGKIQ
jgi:membrane-associated phospholipid phosphatase